MDREPEELQHMGLFGIYREAYNITVSWRKIFSQITLSLILPLSLIFLAQIPISELVISMINKTPDANSSVALYAFKAIYSLFFLILFLISISAVVYTIASIYSSKEVTFKKVISVVPIVWKRLMITFLWNFLFMFLYSLLAVLLILFAVVITILCSTGASTPDGDAVLIYLIGFVLIFSIPYVVGVVYISVIWHLANVISILEETYGLEAMKKSKKLMKGKMWIASAIIVKLKILIGAIVVMFNSLVVHGESIGMVGRGSLGILCFLLLTILIHFTLVIITIFYFVCKSYHNESIDKSYLAGYLAVYHQGDYAPLISDQNVQSEQFSV